ncbi:MAG: hypothetical protein A3G24_02960 [Betaproteobacteria bacterium RIFCSPLOWO2_12_FULL_62_13]|nr:MAG: hypothetical protein A3G24_02960 [Betaproteobacteria bacterium RIFCSPLOWO2_12_FULL_62_13]
MKLASLDAIVSALQDAGVRYLVAGGLAVNAHGYLRFTHDVDIVIQLQPGNIIPAFHALASLGYRPMVPVTAEQFADETLRQQWIRDKGMQVLNFQSDQHRETPIDVFVTEPFEFDRVYAAAPNQELAPGAFIRVVPIPTLIAMKQVANRPRDVDDIQHLHWLLEEKRGDRSDT